MPATTTKPVSKSAPKSNGHAKPVTRPAVPPIVTEMLLDKVCKNVDRFANPEAAETCPLPPYCYLYLRHDAFPDGFRPKRVRITVEVIE